MNRSNEDARRARKIESALKWSGAVILSLTAIFGADRYAGNNAPEPEQASASELFESALASYNMLSTYGIEPIQEADPQDSITIGTMRANITDLAGRLSFSGKGLSPELSERIQRIEMDLRAVQRALSRQGNAAHGNEVAKADPAP